VNHRTERRRFSHQPVKPSQPPHQLPI
jgi:hypothetical protein